MEYKIAIHESNDIRVVGKATGVQLRLTGDCVKNLVQDQTNKKEIMQQFGASSARREEDKFKLIKNNETTIWM